MPSEATNPASWIGRPSFERQRDFNPLNNALPSAHFLSCDYPGATRKASSLPLIHVEQGFVNLNSGQLNFLP
jgi:hypothetical protein